jgi:serine/threonine-protein kinase
MGRVYRAEQIATHRPVAIKLLTGGGVDPARLAAFRREASTLAGLEHPHIVPLYDYGEHDGIPYLVVRFLSGGTVADRLASGPIELERAVRWVGDVADALDAAHRRGVTHRDVKPSNMLLDEAGLIYLGDFGIAATAVDLATAPHSGSAAYASPEQARGEAPDARSDVYSLAASAFEMLTGRKPYEAETALGMMVRHMHDPVPSARAVRPSLGATVDSAIAAGMAKDANERPASAGAFARRLREAASIPAEAAEATRAAPARRPSPLVAIGVGLFLAVACLAGLGLFGGGIGAWLAASDRATPTSRRATPPSLPSPTAVPATPFVPFGDEFEDPASGFGTTPPEEPDGVVAYADGRLNITVWTPGIELFSPYTGLMEQDVQVEVESSLVSGPAGSETGVACRWTDVDNHVAAAVRADGMVSLWKKSDGAVDRWLDWTALPPSATGTTGASLRLICRGSEVRFDVNGINVAVAADPSPTAGSLALMGGLLEPGEAVVAFDRLQVGSP